MSVEKEITSDLRELGTNGFVGFSVKAKNTDINQAIHDSFKEFCRCETDDNYTLGIKALLDLWEQHYKLLMLMEKIAELDTRISQLEDKPKVDEERKVF